MIQSTGKSRENGKILHMALVKLIEANFISRSVVGQTECFSFVQAAVREVGWEYGYRRIILGMPKDGSQWYSTFC